MPGRPPAGHRGAALSVAAVLLLGGCAPSPAPPPAPAAAAATPPAEPAPAAGAPADVPVVRATPAPAADPVPPVRLEVPGRDVDVRVVPVGVTRGGAMALPEDPAVAGWYRWSADGDADRGATVLAAHVDSLRFGLGPFVRIRDLPKDAAIRLTTGDGTRRTYRVDSIERVRKAALPADRIFRRTGPHRLVLVTCGGRFDPASRTYSDNVVVTARADPPPGR